MHNGLHCAPLRHVSLGIFCSVVAHTGSVCGLLELLLLVVIGRKMIGTREPLFLSLLPHGVGPPVRFMLQLPAQKLPTGREQEPEVSECGARVAAGISDQSSGRAGMRSGICRSWSSSSRSSGRCSPVSRGFWIFSYILTLVLRCTDHQFFLWRRLLPLLFARFPLIAVT